MEKIEPSRGVELRDFIAQGTACEGLIKTLEDGHFVHAYLITGQDGVGKKTLAREVAKYLLCTGEQKPCGTCAACQQVQQGTHPDLLTVRAGFHISSDQATETGKNFIIVDTIRELVAKVNEHAYEGGYRIVIMEHAEKMNPSAQNALLKTLEEPPENVLFLLLTDTPGSLLSTIVSRCRQIALHPWPDSTVKQVLAEHGYVGIRAAQAVQASGGSIGKALEMAGDDAYWENRKKVMKQFLDIPDYSSVYSIANEWKEAKDQGMELLDDLEDMVRTMLLCHLGRADMELVSDLPAAFQKMTREGSNESFLHILDSIHDARRKRLSQVTWPAVLERLLLDIMEEKKKW